ncbi:hypothetical protein GCM10020218_027040 [Dactylosporangium vinaceum]
MPYVVGRASCAVRSGQRAVEAVRSGQRAVGAVRRGGRALRTVRLRAAGCHRGLWAFVLADVDAGRMRMRLVTRAIAGSCLARTRLVVRRLVGAATRGRVRRIEQRGGLGRGSAGLRWVATRGAELGIGARGEAEPAPGCVVDTRGGGEVCLYGDGRGAGARRPSGVFGGLVSGGCRRWVSGCRWRLLW